MSMEEKDGHRLCVKFGLIDSVSLKVSKTFQSVVIVLYCNIDNTSQQNFLPGSKPIYIN